MAVTDYTDTIKTLDPEALGGLAIDKFMPLLSKLGVVFKAAVYLGVVVLGVVLFYQLYLRFNKMAIIRLTSGGKIVDTIIDKCLVHHDKKSNMKKVVTWKKINGMRMSLPLIEGKYKYKCGKKDLFEFWVDDNMQLQPCELQIPTGSLMKKIENKVLGGLVELDIDGLDEEDKAKIKLKPSERDAWSSIERKIQREKIEQKGFFDKYGQYVVPIIAYATIFLLFYFGFKELGGAMNRLAGAFQQVAQSCL